MLFQTPPITEREAQIVAEIDALSRQLSGAMPALREWPGLPRRALAASAMRGTNERQPGAAARAAAEDVRGYRAALSFVLQISREDFVYDEGLLRALHYMMTCHDPAKLPGLWRRNRVFVRRQSPAEVLYAPPPPKLVPSLLAELIGSLNAAGGSPAIITAAMAHLNLAAIHPFVDANGRMSRALQTLVLARSGITAPAFASIDEYLSVNSAEYDKALKEVHGGAWRPEADARPWIRFCLTAHWRQAKTLARRTREYDRLWEALEREAARLGLPERTVAGLAEAALGRRWNRPLYRSEAGISAEAARRELKRLVDAELLAATKHQGAPCYVAGKRLKAIRARERDAEAPEPDPFTG
jgi:Fic family protein